MENFGEQAVNKEKAKYGANVTLHAIFTRHGEKVMGSGSPETPLTPKGEEASRQKGREMSKRDAIKGYTSNTGRTIKTAEAMVEESPTEKKMHLKKRPQLAYVYDENGTFTKEFTIRRNELLGDDFKDLPPEEQEERVRHMANVMTDYFLAFGRERPDPKSYSPVETAATVASAVDRYIRMAERLKSDSEIDLVNATHDFNVACFLKELMIREVEGKPVTGFDSIADIGGPIEYNEGFEVLVKTDETGAKSIKLLFRGQEYDMDMARFEELVQIARKLEDEQK